MDMVPPCEYEDKKRVVPLSDVINIEHLIRYICE